MGRFQRADGWLAGSARLVAAGAIVAGVLGASSFNAGHGTSVFGTLPALRVYNGLGLPVVVTVDGVSVTVPATSSAPLTLPEFGHHQVEAKTVDGRVIESFKAEAKASGHPIYNVAGAAPMGEWSVRYGPGEPPAPRMLGTMRWFDSRADYIFTEPPGSLKVARGESATRVVLESAGHLAPEHQLSLLDEKEQLRIGHLHAQWDETSHRHYVVWLAFVSKDPERMRTVLEQRLKVSPGDVPLRRFEMDTVAPEQRGALCADFAQRANAAPADGDLLYLALRCQREAPGVMELTIAASERFPDNTWLLNSASYYAMYDGRWTQARAGFEKVAARAPALADQASMQVARLRRATEDRPDLRLLARKSPRLEQLMRVDAPGGSANTDPVHKAYRLLGQGRLVDAIDGAKSRQGAADHILRMAAGSTGASADMRVRALALPLDQGADRGALLTTLALAIKEGRDVKAISAALQELDPHSHGALLDFLLQLKKGVKPAQAEKLLARQELEVRALAFSAAVVLMGERVPSEWKTLAQKVLFDSERPYFG